MGVGTLMLVWQHSEKGGEPWLQALGLEARCVMGSTERAGYSSVELGPK